MRKIIWSLIVIAANIVVLMNYSCSPTLPKKEPWLQINLPDQRLTTIVGQGVILSIQGQASNVERMQIVIDQRIVNDVPMSISADTFEVFVSDFGSQGIKDIVVRAINRRGAKDYSFKIENDINKLKDLAYNSNIKDHIKGGRITRFLNLSNGPYAHPVRVRVPPYLHPYINGIEEGMNFWRQYAGIDYEIQAIDFDPPDCSSQEVEGYLYIYFGEHDSTCGYYDYRRFEDIGGGILLLPEFKISGLDSQARVIAHEMGHILGLSDTYSANDHTIMDWAGTFYLYPYQIYAVQLVYQKNPGDPW